MGVLARRAAAVLLLAAALLVRQVASPTKASADVPRSDEGEACAMLTADGELVLLRGTGELEDGDLQVVVDINGATWEGRLYTDIESLDLSDGSQAPWSGEWREITSLRVADGCVVRPTSCAYLFANLRNLERADLDGLDASSATSMRGMFSGCASLESLDLGTLDTSSMTDTGQAFGGCDSLREVTLGERFSFRGNGIDDEALMAILPGNGGAWRHEGDEALALTPEQLRDTYDGATMAGTWSWTDQGEGAGDGNPTEKPGDDTSSPSPAPMLRGTNRGLWDDLEGEAYACYDPQWHYLWLFRSTDAVVDGEQQTVTDIRGRSWTGIIWGGIETTPYATADDVPWHRDGSKYVSMFSIVPGSTIRPISCAWWLGCTGSSLTTASLSGLDTSICESMAHMFHGCSNLYSIDVSGLDTSRVTNMSGMFANCAYITSLDCSGFDTSNVTTMGDHSATDGMFSGCTKLRTLDIIGWDTSGVTDMSGLFAGCYRLNPVPAGELETGAVTDMGHMFDSCSAATSLDLSGFDTSGVTNMASMFYRCSGLTSLELDAFDTSGVTDMSAMFQECSSLTALDLTPLETQSVTTMAQMFWGCKNLASLDISSIDTSSATTLRNAFYQCSSLSEVTLGQDFSFKGGAGTSSSDWATLPTPPTNDTYTGKWARADDPDVFYLGSTLRDIYDGETMSGTWVWGTYRTYPLTLDLAGGSAPEGEEYPTSYTSQHELMLPGCDGSGLSFPERYGYRFYNWVDEEGKTCSRIEATSQGERTITAVWRPIQIEVHVPVAATLVATEGADGTVSLVPESGDFELCLDCRSAVPIVTTVRATAADGFELSDSDDLADGQADLWFTPVTTGSDPTNSGYDKDQDEGYREYGRIRLSQCGDGVTLAPTMGFFDRIWLNDLGGAMGGWSENDGSKALVAQINWTFAIAP